MSSLHISWNIPIQFHFHNKVIHLSECECNVFVYSAVNLTLINEAVASKW